jgi:hypothetical protein
VAICTSPGPGTFTATLVNTGEAASEGMSDPTWTVTSSGYTGAAYILPSSGNQFPFQYWYANDGTSKWISIPGTPSNDAVGTYTFSQTFTISGPGQPTSLTLSGQVGVDDALTSITVNGNAVTYTNGFVPSTATYSAPSPFSFTASTGLVLGSNTVEFVVSNAHSVVGLRVAWDNGGSASIVGDPHMRGFLGQDIIFDGIAGSSFHIISDPYMSINSLFDYAEVESHTGTVMTAFHIVTAQDELLVRLEDISSSNSLQLSLNKKLVVLAPQSVVQTRSNCSSLMWMPPNLMFTSPSHDIIISWSEQYDAHINRTFLNLALKVPIMDPTVLGGVLGQTARLLPRYSTAVDDFIVSKLDVHDSRSESYANKPLTCEQGQTFRKRPCSMA